MKAKATKRARAMRAASDDERDGKGDKGSGRATVTRAMAAATTAVVGKDEGGGNGNEGGG